MKSLHCLAVINQKWNFWMKRQLRSVGIFKRLNLSFLLLLLLSSFFLTFFSFYQYSAEINLNLNRYVSLLVQNVNLKVQDTLKEYEDIALDFYNNEQVIKAICKNALLTEPLTAAGKSEYEANTVLIENKLYTMRLNRKHIVNIEFVSPTRQYHTIEASGFQRGGTILDLNKFYKSEFYLRPQSQSGYPVWMDSPQQTDIFYKNEQNIYGIGNIITLGVAVYEPVNREFLGVLLFNIDLGAFSNVMEGYEAYNDGNTFLVGANGVLTSFNPSISAPSFPMDSGLFSEMLRKGQDITRVKIDGSHMLIAYEKIENTEICASYIADLDLLLKPTYRIRNLCILVLAGIVIACFLISYYVTISISDPIRQLIHVMHKTGDGKWTVRYDNTGHDEVTQLGDRFNEMAEKTEQLIKQVYLSEIRRQSTLLSWKNAQLDAMLMQINPHFLYNTLDIIRWEAMYEANGESPVTQMIEKFSCLCRMSMRAGSDTIRLSESIEHASTYLDIINFRHNDKIQLTIHTDVDADHVYIPQFVLQPIMENAVVHAFGDASRGYHIQIDSFCREQTLHVLVRDNGRGMTPKELSLLEASICQNVVTHKSIGLVNVNQRIRLFYGESYGLCITSEPGTGTQVEITLPLRDHSENMEKDTNFIHETESRV